jgi:hypothetical protein
MKQTVLVITALLLALVTRGQGSILKGSVTFTSSKNVYVKFVSTADIRINDTLYVIAGDVLTPALLVTNKSSSSCVCSKLGLLEFRVNDEIAARVPVRETKKEEPVQVETEVPAANPEQKAQQEEGKVTNAVRDKQKIRARIAVASYSSLFDGGERHRMRYSLNFQGNNINNSKFSTDNYIVFRHTLGEWTDVQENLNNALKVYSLSVKYQLNDRNSVTLGRKINPKMASVGAIDGLQYEGTFSKSFTYGVVAGSRPNFTDYSFDLSLFQAGAFAGYSKTGGKVNTQMTLGLLDQFNGGSTDRRFLYFQSNTDVAKNLNLFSSMELDTYQKVNGEISAKPQLTNFFVSARYRFSKKLNATLSFDTRKNIIYYESYKSFIDQLIENESRQGLRLNLSYHPWKLITVGVNGSMRFQQATASNFKNVNCFANINRLPGIKANLSLNANILRTGFVNSNIYSARLSKDFFKGKLNMETYYRYVQYRYSSEYQTKQNVVGGSISFNITKKQSLFIYTEKTFTGGSNDFLLFNTKLMHRF